MSAVLDRPTSKASVPLESRALQLLDVAGELFSLAPSWVDFFRAILGTDGELARLFPDPEEQEAARRTPQFEAVQQMLQQLRQDCPQSDGKLDPQRVITVRLPASLHESLLAEAHGHHTSLNQLCISKLLQLIESDVPSSIRGGNVPWNRGYELAPATEPQR